MRLLSFSAFAIALSIKNLKIIENRINNHHQKASAKRIPCDSGNRNKSSLDLYTDHFVFSI
jgi:hypothetical protein